MNRVILMGTVGFDPVIRRSQISGPFVVFTLITDEQWVDIKGSKKERFDRHKVVVFKPKLAEWCHLHLKKGTKVIVEGKLCNHKQSTQEGEEIYASEVIIGSGYGYITTIFSTQVKKEMQKSTSSFIEEEAGAQDEEDRLALERASEQFSIASQPSLTSFEEK